MVDRLHGEVPGHEFDDGFQPGEGGADPDPGEAVFGDGRIDDAGGTELIEQPLSHLVGPLVLADFLADDEDRGVRPHLLGHGVTERLAHGELDHRRTRREFGLGAWFLRGNLRAGRRLFHQRRRLAEIGRGFFGTQRCDRFRSGRGTRHRHILAVGNEERDRPVDLHMLGALGHEDRAHPPVLGGLDFHRRLVGFDLGDDIAGAHGIALAHHPFGELPLFHGGRQRRHEDLGWHQTLPGLLNSPSRR